MNKSEEALKAYYKFASKGKILGVSFTKLEELKKFSDIQKELKAYTSSDLGIQNVPLDKIVGSVQKTEDFYKGFIPKNKVVKQRWCDIYIAMLGDISLPPVVLYKIKDEYYVYDGNHRISVANFLNFKSIEAEVTEFFSNEGEDANKYRKNFEFVKQTNLDIELTKSEDYKIILSDIEAYNDASLLEKSNLWYKNIYQPIVEILTFNNFIKDDNLPGDIFVDFLKHREYMKKKYNLEDYSFNIINYMNMEYLKEKPILESQIKVNARINYLIETLYKFDKERSLDAKEKARLEEIRTYIRGDFVDEYYFLKSVKGNISEWFENYVNYSLVTFKEKASFRKESKIIFERKLKLYKELKEYFDVYKKENKDARVKEGILDYIIEIFIPTIKYLNNENLEEKIYVEKYFNLSHRKIKFLKKGKKLSAEELEKLYPRLLRNAAAVVEDPTIKEWLLKTIEKEKKYKGDILKSVRELLLIKGQNVEDFDELINIYGGTTNYETVIKMKKEIWNVVGENPKNDWVGEVFSKKIDEVLQDIEKIGIFKTKRFMNYIKKKSDVYTLIDFLYI